MNKKFLTLISLFLSIILTIFGLHLGQNSSVLAKAIKICLECIGIG